MEKWKFKTLCILNGPLSPPGERWPWLFTDLIDSGRKTMPCLMKSWMDGLYSVKNPNLNQFRTKVMDAVDM